MIDILQTQKSHHPSAGMFQEFGKWFVAPYPKFIEGLFRSYVHICTLQYIYGPASLGTPPPQPMVMGLHSSAPVPLPPCGVGGGGWWWWWKKLYMYVYECTVKPYNKKLFQSCQTLADFLTGRVPLRNLSRSPDSQSTFLNPSVLLVLPTASRLKSHLPKILLRRGRIFCLAPCLCAAGALYKAPLATGSQDPCSCSQAL